MSHRTTLRALALLALSAALVAGCTDGGGPGPTTPEPTGSASTADGTPDADTDTVQVLGMWSGPELTAFESVKATWEEETGASVEWQATQDPATDLAAAIAAGDPPDVAILPNPGLMQQLAAEGALVPLDEVLDMDQVAADYSPAWLDLGSADGRLYALFSKVTSKSTVWYSPPAFAAAGYQVPTTWADLVSLAEQMVADGHTPLSLVAPLSPAAGWALTDMVAQLVLTGCGPDVYDGWVTGDVPWTDPCIRQSFDTFAATVAAPGYVLGGSAGILSTTDAAGAYPLYTDPPTAYLYPMASFAQAFIAAQYPTLKPGTDYDAFEVPAVDPQYAGTVMVGADVVVMLNDTPTARSFLGYLTGAQAQASWIGLGGFTSVNRSVPMDTYPDPVSREVAEQLTDATATRFGAGDSMPAALQRAWWAAMVDLVGDPGSVDAVLERLDAAALGAD